LLNLTINFKDIISPLFYLITMVLCFSIKAQPKLKPPEEIILLIGQSNMAGRANLMDKDYEIIRDAFLLDSMNQWVPLKSRLNIHSSIRKKASMQRFNLGYSFAQEILTNNDIKTVGMIVNARGGTKIDQWVPGSHYFKEAIRRCQFAIEDQGKITATFWLQGSGNLGDKDPGFSIYFEKLKSIILNLRKELSNDQMIFIASELNKKRPENEDFKKMLDRLNTEIPHGASVKSAGTSTYDGTHYDRRSLEVLGKRFASKFRELYKNQN